MFNSICRNPRQARLFMRQYSHAQIKPDTERPTQHYGYIASEDGSEKRDKENKGIVHIGKVNLPKQLKESLKLYYKKYSEKRITEDGLQLSRHLSNRGRPTHATWLKYKKDVNSTERGRKKAIRNLVKQFSLDEAIEAGLVSENTSDEVSENTSAEINDSDNDQITELNDDIKKSEEKSKMKRPQLSEYSMIRYGSRETAAYVASQLPSVYGSTYKSLYEIKKRLPDYQPNTILDFGSGTGMSVWAASQIWKNSISEYQCVDASEDMNYTAEYLLRGGSDIRTPLKIPNVYFKRFLPLSNQIMYDVVIAAYTLTEMPFQKQRLQAIQSLWRKTNDFLVIIEPGNNEGFEIALQARKYITGRDKVKEEQYDYSCYEDSFVDYNLDTGNEEDGHIFAPCPHELVCARTDVTTRDHPCNFSQKVELSLAYQTTPLKKLSYFNERFSYIILRKDNSEATKGMDDISWARILEPVKSRRRHVICELCCHNGNIEKHLITKRKDKHVYKAARHILKWGDMMPLDEVKRPMNIRPSISSPESK